MKIKFFDTVVILLFIFFSVRSGCTRYEKRMNELHQKKMVKLKKHLHEDFKCLHVHGNKFELLISYKRVFKVFEQKILVRYLIHGRIPRGIWIQKMFSSDNSCLKYRTKAWSSRLCLADDCKFRNQHTILPDKGNARVSLDYDSRKEGYLTIPFTAGSAKERIVGIILRFSSKAKVVKYKKKKGWINVDFSMIRYAPAGKIYFHCKPY